MRSHDVPRLQSFVENRWIDVNETLIRRSPADRRIITAHVGIAPSEVVEAAFGSSAGAFISWRRASQADRTARVSTFLEQLRRNQEQIARAIVVEMGKPLSEARLEVTRALETARFQLEYFSSVKGNDAFDLSALRELREPLGVVAVITPWNFPVATALRKAVPALLAGNTVVYKPSELAPISAALLMRAAGSSDIPPGVLNCVPGDGRVGKLMIEHPTVSGISFTGSTSVGLQIIEAVGTREVSVQLEMGGKNATVVMGDSDLSSALAGVATSSFTCTGQWCLGTSRVILEERIAEQFIDQFVGIANAIRIGDGMDDGTQMGPLASDVQLERVATYVNRAVTSGADLRAGGMAPSGRHLKHGAYFPPTIVDRIDPASPLAMDEIFGPVVAMFTVGSLDEAIELTNGVEYGLSAAIYTKSRNTSAEFVTSADVGRVSVNHHSGITSPTLALGGRKASGRGEPENGASARRFFTRHKAVYIDAEPLDN